MIDDSDDELGRSQNSRQEEESEELHYSVAVEDPQNYRGVVAHNLHHTIHTIDTRRSSPQFDSLIVTELTDAVTPRRSPGIK